ncbi:Alpha/Beta hydrolase protein [Xylaria bambusicola]|uniref:Alpha/Beta hydrolase protein n=1 Tax=Xylaria bambusicola TaxID=326684 RepID=UPI002007F1C1|nr:Alpha/Beta hydrolase protein [Xylaria bambusicola]KAI0518494.1 Alpha/Beta hydrolase protein [Xylaria bambusicola]
MDKLPPLGRGIEQVLLPTFAAYEDLLKANEADIRSARRETHSYGPNPRHVLDVYFPDDASKIKGGKATVLVFLHGGGFYTGARINEGYAGGLIFGNIGRFFTAKYGVTVIVPDYRLISHGAKYPSGGEDVALVVDWIKASLAQREGHESVDVVLLGNSAGGVHVLTFLLDGAFEAEREAVLAEDAAVRLRGVITLGAPFHWGGFQDDAIRTYLGENTIEENASLSKLQAAIQRGAKLPTVKILILVSELDPQLMFTSAEEFKAAWKDADIEIKVLEGHNHISPPLGLNTGIEREEAWGAQVAQFLSSCTSD